MGNTCKPMADSGQCMTKFTTKKKKQKQKFYCQITVSHQIRKENSRLYWSQHEVKILTETFED